MTDKEIPRSFIPVLPADYDPDAEPEMELDEATKERLLWWWAQVPDFLKPGYPLDIPPSRLQFAQAAFDRVDAWRFCPEAVCRRRRACRGGDGTPCFRADRAALGEVLYHTWLAIVGGMPREDLPRALEAAAPRYIADDGAEPAPPRRTGKPHNRRTA